ncbi:MAG: acyl-ACP--UDP-N-acetylglucosamine O-acyltransferase [Deltaproteobacteria bacterium]|jgi:UDP-N-acetylglucosamine acyltransferase|nr:acyl-ACP--UDP-N-acetylglucosamine O-acyltransferase [Deltaproteobacteria bacterium]
MGIHPTAVIDPTVQLGENVSVGPYTVIGPRVIIGDNTQLYSHVSIDKDTTIGKECRIFPFASVGADPQDISYQGERTSLIIGDRVTIREASTIHRGTVKGSMVTRVGNHALIMAQVHVAHDCQLGDEVILSSFAVLAGHVRLDNHASVSGSTAIHQFVRVGSYAFVGGMTGLVKDVPPYMIAAGLRDNVAISPNFVGLKRKGFPKEALEAIVGVHRIIHNHKPLNLVLDEALSSYPNSEEAKAIIEFYRSSERGVYR